MRKYFLTVCLALAFVSLSHAQVVEGWKTGVPGEPEGAPPRTGLPAGTVTPVTVLFNGTAPLPTDPNGTTALYLINTGSGQDTTGTNWTHLEAEGFNFGGFQSQLWTQWSGLITKLKADADTAFGADRWTIRKIWVVSDPATGIGVGCNAGLVSLAEVSTLAIKGGVADWGNKSAAPTETGGDATTQLPAGYHGQNMGPTNPVAPCADQGTIDPDVFLLMDETAPPQGYAAGSIAFQKLISGPNNRVRPVQDNFTLYWAPINNATTGAQVGVSYDGWPASSFGFPPYVLFQLVKQNAITGANPPQVTSITKTAPFTAVAGPTCAGTVNASDPDVGDTVTFTITNPGSLGGTISPAGPIAGTNLGGGNWKLDFTYTIPPNQRGVDTFQVQVTDGTNVSFGQIKYVVRGNAIQNSVAYGASSGDPTDTMRLYNGAAVPDGGTQGNLNKLLSPAFAQSAEFDNYNGIRHNPIGNLFALDFGPGPNGPGHLFIYATQTGCTDPGGTTLFTFDAASTGLATDSRPAGLSISPDNTKMACLSVNNSAIVVLNYTPGLAANVGKGGTAAGTVTFRKTIDVSAVMASAKSIGTTWLDNNTILLLDTDGNIQAADEPTGTLTTSVATPFTVTPRVTPNISLADIEYNPEISPYIYVAIGEFLTNVNTNTLYVSDTAGNIIPQSGGQQFTDYSNGTGETFREVGFDCYGNLFIGTFVDSIALIDVKYVPNAKAVGNIVGGSDSLVTWRTVSPSAGENTSNFSGLDVAAGTTIGVPTTCTNFPPAAQEVELATKLGTSCNATLTAIDYNLGDTVTFQVTNPGSSGGTLTLFGPVSQVGSTRTQQATYTAPAGFRGVECFTYKANDGTQNSNNASACVDVRADAADGTVAFGGSLSDSNQTMRLYYGAHVANGGTAGAEDVLSGQAFAQSTEFDNYNSVRHNSSGNLLALNLGTTTAGGALYVYATKALCGGNLGTQIYAFNAANIGTASRVVGLAVSPDNTKIAAYAIDTRKIYVLDYSIPGGAAAVGKGGASAAAATLNTSIDLSAINLTTRSMGLTWLDNATLLWTDETGNLYTVPLAGAPTQVRANPRPATAISMTDIEYNPSISPNIYVSIGEFTSPNSTNTLYIVNSAGFAIVPQSGGVQFTDFSTVGAPGETHREIGLSTGGKLFIGTAVDASARVNIRYINNATTPGSITSNSSIIWNTQEVGQATSNFSGLDVAAGVPVSCSLPGDMNSDGLLNGKDIDGFTDCYLASFGGVPAAGCICADVAAPFGVINSADLTGFVALLLP